MATGRIDSRFWSTRVRRLGQDQTVSRRTGRRCDDVRVTTLLPALDGSHGDHPDAGLSDGGVEIFFSNGFPDQDAGGGGDPDGGHPADFGEFPDDVGGGEFDGAESLMM